MTLYLLQYNNYYNRIFKKEDSIIDYLPYMVNNAPANNPMTYVNLIPGDGLQTEQDIDITTEFPDYVVYVDDANKIISRWFVVETTRNSAGQYRASLRRDILADYWDNIASAPMFVEKGYCSIEDNFIFNDEQVSVNQIKQSEELLKDNTKCAWVVGYCAPTTEDAPDEGIDVVYGVDEGYDFYSPTIEDWEFYTYKDRPVKFLKDNSYTFALVENKNAITYTTRFWTFNETGFIGVRTEDVRGTGFVYTKQRTGEALGEMREKIPSSLTPSIPSDMKSKLISNYGLSSDTDLKIKLSNLDGKIIKIGENRYGISLNTDPSVSGMSIETHTEEIISSATSAYGQSWQTFCSNLNDNLDNILENSFAKKDSFRTSYTAEVATLTLTPITSVSGVIFKFPKTRKPLTDAPYCMFCLPYSDNIDIIYTQEGSLKNISTSAANALSVAAGIATSLGSVLYDIQLLPYCPIGRIRETMISGLLDLRKEPFTSWTANYDYLPVEGGDTIIFFADTSTGSFDIPVQSYYTYYNALDFKTNMLTTTLRLCSPNYNGVFEFNPYKNRGFQFVNIDYSYKPFQPYIHVNPNFNGLYGKDYNDARGLICGGDFSLPITSNSWTNYQIQNKNFQEQFNRQIENMEVQHKYQREQEVWNIISGTVTGGVSGAATGLMASGNAYGAIIGGTAGTGVSLLAGLRDREIQDALRDEAKDYTKDLFGLQLDNIRALPNSLTKISAFNANNKLFPFIEFYSCTEEEKTAVSRKLVYNGFTIGRVDTLENNIMNKPLYMSQPGYFKGQLIRLQDFNEDSHLANAIAGELYKGVYI